MAAKNGATNRITFDEFEPLCKWQREEARDTLIVHVPEFKKEQLKVHITNRGILKISGERSVDARKKSKFYKEVAVPRNCNTNGIQAKFANSHLYIIMPKNPAKVVVPEQDKPQEVAGSTVSPADQNEKPEASQDKAAPAKELGRSKKEETAQYTPTPDGTESKKNGTSDVAVSGSASSRGKELAMLAANVGMLVILLAAITAFVAYMYKSTIVDD